MMMRYVARLAGTGLLAAQILSASAVAQPYKLRVATVGVPPSMHTLYMQVAFEQGIYRRNGLVVDELVPLAAGPLVTQALLSGRIDVAETDAEGVLNAASAAAGSIVAVAAPAQHLSYLIAVQPEIKTLKDLVGKPFAISRPGALSQYLMFPALDREGIARNAVTWVPIGGASERRLALVNNRVKGALLHLDYFFAAQRDAKVVALDRVVRSNPDYPHELLVVRKELADKQPAAVAAVTRSIIEACRFMVMNRERTIEIYRWLDLPHWERAAGRLEALGREAAVQLGRAYRDGGRYDAAMVLYGHLLGEVPHDRRVQEGLLLAARGTGDCTQLSQVWQQVRAYLDGETDIELHSMYERLMSETGAGAPVAGR